MTRGPLSGWIPFPEGWYFPFTQRGSKSRSVSSRQCDWHMPSSVHGFSLGGVASQGWEIPFPSNMKPLEESGSGLTDVRTLLLFLVLMGFWLPFRVVHKPFSSFPASSPACGGLLLSPAETDEPGSPASGIFARFITTCPG